MNRIAPALIQALSDEDGYVRAEAATALGKMKLPTPWDQERIDRLLLALKDPDFRVQAAAAEGLPPLDADAELAVPALIGVAGIGASATKEEPPTDKFSLATLAD
jgi:HEAT repeat protein